MEDKLKEEMEGLIEQIKHLNININNTLKVLDSVDKNGGTLNLTIRTDGKNVSLEFESDTLYRMLDVSLDVCREKAVIARNRLCEIINELCIIKGM